MVSGVTMGEQIVDDSLLPAIEPADQDDHEQMPGLEDESHGSVSVADLRLKPAASFPETSLSSG